MSLSWFDLLLLLSVFGFVWGGFWTGLIQAVGGVVGLFLGSIIASRYYERFAGTVAPVFGGNAIAGKVFAFILIFLLVTRLVGVLFWLVNKIFNFMAIIPGLKFVNRLGGAIFGFLEGALFVGITLQFITRLPISVPFAGTIAHSTIAKYFLDVTAWLVPLFPQVIKQAQDATKVILPK
ncbi:MAG: CvpA family protein [Patescibacteria group bacterium]